MTSTAVSVFQPEHLSEAEWTAKEKYAARLAKVSYIPAQFRNKPDDIVAASLALDSIGFPTTVATLKNVYIVNGTVDFLVEVYKALAFRHGCEMWVVEESDTAATVAGTRAGSDRVHTATFTLADAERANLVGKDNWKHYQRDMLVARASKRVAKRIAPEAILGMPPPMRLVADESGRKRVVLVDGESGEILDDDDIVDAELVEEEPGAARLAGEAEALHARLRALPNEARTLAWEEWQKALLPPPPEPMSADELDIARAILSEAEAGAKALIDTRER